jgi:deoxyribonuclease IV
MLPDGRRLGAHLPLGGGMVAAADRAHAIGLDTVQIFGDNPTAWRRRTGPPRELPAFRARAAALDLAPIAIHAPYLINLAGPDDEFYARSVAVLGNELAVAPGFGARFLNVHTGSHKGATAGSIERLAIGIAAGIEAARSQLALAAPDGQDLPIVALENSAGGGGGIGTDIAELAGILEAIRAQGVPEGSVAICLDTAHLWGAGHPINTLEGVDRLVDDFDRAIGLGRLVMVHLNDSRATLGSRQDRHEHLGAGLIGATGIARFLTHPGLRHVTYYLETPGMDSGYDAINARRALELAEGRPLAELPSEALELAGSRARSGPAEPTAD